MLFGVIGGWGRVYQDYLWVTKSLANPPLRIDVVWGYWWVGAGLSRLFVGDKIPREPAPTNCCCLGFLVGGGGVFKIFCGLQNPSRTRPYEFWLLRSYIHQQFTISSLPSFVNLAIASLLFPPLANLPTLYIHLLPFANIS